MSFLILCLSWHITRHCRVTFMTWWITFLEWSHKLFIYIFCDMNAREYIHGIMFRKAEGFGGTTFPSCVYQSEIREICANSSARINFIREKCISHIEIYLDRRNWQSDVYGFRGNSIGSGHVRTKRVKNCKASHEIDDNAGAANAKTFILTQNPKCVFAIARAPRDTWPFFTLFQPGGVRWVVMSTVKRSRKKKILPSYPTWVSRTWRGNKIQIPISLQSCLELYFLFFNFSVFLEYYSLKCVWYILWCNLASLSV